MRSLARLSLPAAVLVLAACAPSIDPQMKAATDALLAAAPASKTLPPPAAYAPMPWRAGQWIVMRMDHAKDGPSVMRLSILSEGPEGFWVETETQDYRHHTISKALYAHMPTNADDGIAALKKMIMKQDDRPAETFDFGPAGGPGAALMKSMMRSMALGTYAPTDATKMPKEDVSVTAGTFLAAARHPAIGQFGPMRIETTGWFHPGVPINGFVKSVSTDGSFTMELVDFGLTGATSRLK